MTTDYKPPLHNPQCDGAHCRSATGTVRVLPLAGDGNLILCCACYAHEVTWRRQRNRDLSPDAQFDTPSWSGLKVYEGSP